MERRDAAILGRKVFFLNPPLAITNHVLESLKEQQYEVYCLEDYKSAKPLLKMFPDALCFIFIDDLLTLREWYNYIKSFEEDDELKSIFIGVISARIRPGDREKFLMNLKLPGGFIPLGGPVSEVLKTIKGIIDVNGALGKRKYIRLDCSNNPNISAYFAEDLKLYDVNIQYLSTAGFTFTMKNPKLYTFQKKSVISNICINVGHRTIPVEGFVYEIRQIDGKEIIILLFTKGIDSVNRGVIRKFIFATLNDRLNDMISMLEPDMRDYSIEGVATDSSEKIDSLEANEILNKIDEVEELENETIQAEAGNTE